MTEEEKILIKRFSELAERSYSNGRYIYTPFLSLAETSVLLKQKNELSYAGLTLWGGAPDCERVVARFGSKELCGPAGPFPIKCIKAAPAMQKYADRLTHRDILGALMNLGIERDTVGDIFIRDNIAYILCTAAASALILGELKKAKHTDLILSEINSPPAEAAASTEEVMLQTASERTDALIAAAYKLSREESAELFRRGLVFSDGGRCENNSAPAKAGAVISVRGFGKFRYLGIVSESRKGKLNVKIAKWV